jgi:uncharacterized protein (TIGR01370 family)
MAKAHSIAELGDEFKLLFSRMKLSQQHLRDIAMIGRRISSADAKSAYQGVSAATGLPWYVIGIIHNLEASLRFDCHLHNGDPLRRLTIHVPRNRPPGWAPGADQKANWIASAIDAITYEKLDTQTDWSIEGIAFALEKFNGFGYRNNHPHVKNPYLWGYSNIYKSGKYVEDGVFDDDAVSDQCGGMTLLRYLMDNDPAIKAELAFNDGHAEENEGPASRPFPGANGPEGTPAPPPTIAPPSYPGYYLLTGLEQDPNVKILQQRLKALRFDPKGVDGDFGPDTEDAVKLFQMRSADPSGEPLDVDGVVGPQTWIALFGASSVPVRDPLPQRDSPFAARVIDVAMSEIGVREVPPGSNRGPKVDQYISAVDPGLVSQQVPWCMCFVYWCFQETARQLGTTVHIPKSAGVRDSWSKTQTRAQQDASIVIVDKRDALRDPSRVKPGMVFFLTRAGGGHTGIVIENNNGMLETIEGNTNDNGSAEGIGVFRRSRRRTTDDNLLGFASFDSSVAVPKPLINPIIPGPQPIQPTPIPTPFVTGKTAVGLTSGSWIYQLQAISSTEIANSDAELAVIDSMTGNVDEAARPFKATEVAAMAKRPSGGRKQLVSYLSIGEAEDYRPYWQDAWKANPPAWLDYDGGDNQEWPGNVKVRYWLPEWKQIILGSASAYLDKIIAAGFDGVYLDIIDGFEFWELAENAGRVGSSINPRAEMIKFVIEIARYARAKKPGFIIIPQNGESLLRSPEYVAVINAIGIESLLYSGKSANPTSAQSQTERGDDLKFATAAGRPAFVVEYVKQASKVKNAIKQLRALGHVPYCGPKLLDELRAPWNAVS